MYVMVIEDYEDENYISYVRSKEYIQNYKKRAWGYSKKLTKRGICKLIALCHYARWNEIIDLKKKRFLTLEERRNLWKKYGKEKYTKLTDADFIHAFKYNLENS